MRREVCVKIDRSEDKCNVRNQQQRLIESFENSRYDIQGKKGMGKGVGARSGYYRGGGGRGDGFGEK
jgi:hypothetical protein